MASTSHPPRPTSFTSNSSLRSASDAATLWWTPKRSRTPILAPSNSPNRSSTRRSARRARERGFHGFRACFAKQDVVGFASSQANDPERPRGISGDEFITKKEMAPVFKAPVLLKSLRKRQYGRLAEQSCLRNLWVFLPDRAGCLEERRVNQRDTVCLRSGGRADWKQSGSPIMALADVSSLDKHCQTVWTLNYAIRV
ncbi:hypothetical protein L596_014681 [Steinernema carpocapsae]|uniref:Uncharacterized protein n=1 Tax=Steinernema carpocapsae TaxID=34508 RepID=A0A4U5NCL6_STECR|nr:hypothetical protein L596_014681 [Steinernema carpocapsae]